MNKYELHSVTIGYGEHIVASGLSGALAEGEMVCLIGSNGTGKSTLLRTMAGFMPPINGRLTIDDKDITILSRKEMAKTIGIVLTERMEVDNMTVSDLVETGRSPYTGFFGKLNRTDRDIVKKSLEMVGMADFAMRMINTLSDGERQKVIIAKALAQQTPIILLDEPMAFLDYPSKVETLRLLKHLCQEQHKAVLISTHDLDVAMRITDKVWIMTNDEEGNTTLVTGNCDELKERIYSEFFYETPSTT